MQDASHVIVQRASQVEVDLDQAAAMLCHEMQEGCERQAAIGQLAEQLVMQKKHSCMAMTAVSVLGAQLQQKASDLYIVNQELILMKVPMQHDHCTTKPWHQVAPGSGSHVYLHLLHACRRSKYTDLYTAFAWLH